MQLTHECPATSKNVVVLLELAIVVAVVTVAAVLVDICMHVCVCWLRSVLVKVSASLAVGCAQMRVGYKFVFIYLISSDET